MGEQEQYKQIMKKMIEQTENLSIKSSEQFLKTLIQELTNRELKPN